MILSHQDSQITSRPARTCRLLRIINVISGSILIGFGIILSLLLLCGQTLALFDYELTVKLGLQESEKEVGAVGVSYAKGFGFGDTLIYLPMLLL